MSPEPAGPGPTEPAPDDGGAGAAAPPLDGDRLGTLQRSGGSALVAELVDLFVSDVPGRIEGIRTAMSAEDVETLQHIAHSLKGSAATLGADPMSRICHRIELHARSGELDPAAELFASLEAEFERVKDALAAWVAAL